MPNDPIAGIGEFISNLFDPAYYAPKQTPKGPDFADAVFADWPVGKTNPWNKWDPGTEEFWAQVRANQRPAGVPSVTESARRMAGPRPVAPPPMPPDALPPPEGKLGNPPSAPLSNEAPRPVAGSGTSGTWTRTNATWLGLTSHQRAAAMALMEADSAKPSDAKNALAAMINRSKKEGVELGQHVSTRVYQPTFEPAQQARLQRILNMPEFNNLTEWSKRYDAGQEADPVKGATHFLAHPKVMLNLEASNPRKYRSWRGWTGYDPKIGDYRNVLFRDSSHSFLTP